MSAAAVKLSKEFAKDLVDGLQNAARNRLSSDEEREEFDHRSPHDQLEFLLVAVNFSSNKSLMQELPRCWTFLLRKHPNESVAWASKHIRLEDRIQSLMPFYKSISYSR